MPTPLGGTTPPGNTTPYGSLDVSIDFSTALAIALKANASLAALVESRIYPLVVPETKPKPKPTLVYAIAETSRLRNLSGYAGMSTSQVLFDARSPLYSDCQLIKEILRQYDGFRGYLAGNIEVLSTRFDDNADEFEWPGGSGGAPGTHHETVVMYFKYREPIPVQPE